MAWWIKGETESWSPKLTGTPERRVPEGSDPGERREPLKEADLPRQASLAHAEANAVAAGGKSPH